MPLAHRAHIPLLQFPARCAAPPCQRPLALAWLAVPMAQTAERRLASSLHSVQASVSILSPRAIHESGPSTAAGASVTAPVFGPRNGEAATRRIPLPLPQKPSEIELSPPTPPPTLANSPSQLRRSQKPGLFRRKRAQPAGPRAGLTARLAIVCV
jgi:hypothetical protein